METTADDQHEAEPALERRTVKEGSKGGRKGMAQAAAISIECISIISIFVNKCNLHYQIFVVPQYPTPTLSPALPGTQ